MGVVSQYCTVIFKRTKKLLPNKLPMLWYTSPS